MERNELPTRHDLEAVGYALPVDEPAGRDGAPPVGQPDDRAGEPVRLADLTGLTALVETTDTRDPQGAYTRLREQWGAVAPVELEPGINAWLVLGYSELRDVSRNDRWFSSDPANWSVHREGRTAQDPHLRARMTPEPHTASRSDGAEHRRLRAPLDEGLAKLDEHLTADMIQEMCNSLIERFTDRGSADLVAEYANVVPLLAVAGMVGLDRSQLAQFMELTMAMTGGGPAAEPARLQLLRMMADVAHSRLETPERDLASSLVHHPDLHGDDEVAASMMHVFTAGHDLTIAWVTNTLRLMLADARFAGRVLGGRLGVEDALEEVLWRDPPMANMPGRYALTDCVLGGRLISKGDALVLSFSGANNDPSVHTGDPWEESGNRAHLGWGVGVHACPAPRHGRLIARTAVETALHRLENLRLAVPVEELPLLVRPWSRYPKSLPVTFRPQGVRAVAAGPTSVAPPPTDLNLTKEPL